MEGRHLSSNEEEAIQSILSLICEAKSRGYDISQLQIAIGGENNDAVREDRVFSRFRSWVRSCVNWKYVQENGRRVVIKMSKAILQDALPDESGGARPSLREFLLGIIPDELEREHGTGKRISQRFDELKNFVKSNIETCKWIGTQASGALVAMVLKALGSVHGNYYNSDDEYNAVRLPLLNIAMGGKPHMLWILI